MSLLKCIASCLIALAAVDGHADLRINEVLYDPPGPDAGSEFVELVRVGDSASSLDGYELWFVNGATPEGSPRVVWRATAGLSLAPGAFHVIGGAEVTGRDDTAELGLQNGPDALWLVRAGARVDAVAWGDAGVTIGEGEPAPLVTAVALGRVPDGADTEDNATDFRPLPRPTPGEVNLPASAIEPIELVADPPWRADAGPVSVRASWRAEGWAATQAATVQWLHEAIELVAAPGETLVTTTMIDLPLGRTTLVAGGTGRRMERVVQTGVADVVITEVQARPESGEPEWIELHMRGTAAVALADWAVADAQAVPRRIGEDLVILPGERVVLTVDVASWRAFHSGAAVEVARPSGGWSTLNDSDGDHGYADGVSLFDADGVLVDRMTYRARDLAERGRSLQRTGAVHSGASVWIASLAGSTPGTAHAAESQRSTPTTLMLDRTAFTPDGDGIDDVLQIVAPRARGHLTAEVRDLAGVLVRELEGVTADDRGYWQWDGRDERGREVPAGAYVILVRGETDEGEVTTWRALVGLDIAR